MAGSSKATEPGAQAARGAADAAPRQRLNRPAILAAATRLIERDGLAALTTRRLGGELDVWAMALYRHLPNRDSLIDGVADLAIDELYADPEVLLTPDGGWQDYLRRLAHGLRRLALRPPPPVPAGRRPAPGGPVGPAAASQPALDRVLPFRAERPGLLRRHCRLCLPRVHQLPARSPAVGGRRPRRGHQHRRRQHGHTRAAG